MMIAIAMAATLAVGQSPEDLSKVRRDYFALDAVQQARIRYLIYPPADDSVDWLAAVSWGVATAAVKQPDLSAAKPVEVAPGIAAIDLVSLKWDFPTWLRLVHKDSNPYNSTTDNPLFVRAPWFLAQLADSTESDAYTELQFGAKKELNRDKLLELMAVDRKAADGVGLANGWLEVESQVAINRERVVEVFATLGGSASGTRDFLKLQAGNRPLDRPDLVGLRHDGEEWIVTSPKVWPGGRGAVQHFFLSDGRGALVQEAPVRLVEDKTKFRGVTSIRYPGSCWRCHSSGYNMATDNGLEKLIKSGVELQVDSPETQAVIERKWLSDLERVIKRAEEDLEEAAEYITGMPLQESIDNWMAAIDEYDKDVTLEAAAGELGVAGEDFKTYLAAASDKADIGLSLVQLAHGHSIRRTVWEGVFLEALSIVEELEK